MSANLGMTLVAAGLAQYAAGVPSWTWQTGGFNNAIGDTGVGDAAVTLQTDHQVDPTEAYIEAHAFNGAANSNINTVHSSDTAIQVLGAVAAVATDLGFYIAVYRRNQG